MRCTLRVPRCTWGIWSLAGHPSGAMQAHMGLLVTYSCTWGTQSPAVHGAHCGLQQTYVHLHGTPRVRCR